MDDEQGETDEEGWDGRQITWRADRKDGSSCFSFFFLPQMVSYVFYYAHITPWNIILRIYTSFLRQFLFYIAQSWRWVILQQCPKDYLSITNIYWIHSMWWWSDHPFEVVQRRQDTQLQTLWKNLRTKGWDRIQRRTWFPKTSKVHPGFVFIALPFPPSEELHLFSESF